LSAAGDKQNPKKGRLGQGESVVRDAIASHLGKGDSHLHLSAVPAERMA